MYTCECASCACPVTIEARSYGTGIIGNYEPSNMGARNLTSGSLQDTKCS